MHPTQESGPRRVTSERIQAPCYSEVGACFVIVMVIKRPRVMHSNPCVVLGGLVSCINYKQFVCCIGVAEAEHKTVLDSELALL